MTRRAPLAASTLAVVASVLASIVVAQPRDATRARVEPVGPDGGLAAPLSAEQRRIVEDVPDEPRPPPRYHFPMGNEWRHDLVYPYLDGLGGAYVGVGSDQSYTLAAAARAELAWLVDYDPLIRNVHEIYGALVRESETAEALVARFSRGSRDESIRVLERQVADPERRAEAIRLYRSQRPAFEQHLRRVLRPRGGRRTTWLSTPGLYARVRALFRAGRIVARTGDVTGRTTMRAVGEAARRIGVTVRVVYLSNAEQYFDYGEPFVENIGALPTDERSVVVRTSPRTSPRRPDMRAPPGCIWHYTVQPVPDYLARMRAGYRRSWQIDLDATMGPRDPAWPVGLSVITSAVPLRHGRRPARGDGRALP